jgi:uncharacterized protein YlzI (FlbEa/FlbD family)
MKRIVVLFTLTLLSLCADLSVDQIKEMVNKIHEKREGVALATLEKTKEPFVRFKTEDDVKEVVIPQSTEEIKLELHALMEGKAYINDSWKEVNDTIAGYRIGYIGKYGVVLRDETHVKTLFLQKENHLIKLEGR